MLPAGLDTFDDDFLLPPIYREGLKNRETGKEASSNFRSGASGRAQEHAASEDEQFEEKPTPPGTDSSITSGIKRRGGYLEWSLRHRLNKEILCRVF
jgi:hypothetical protein